MAARRTERPDWRFLTLLFFVVSALELTAWGHLIAFTPLYLRDELGLGTEAIDRWAGILAASSLAVALPLAPFWGVLADRYSRKAVILRSLVVEIVAYAGLTVASDLWQLLALRLLLGLAFGSSAVAIAALSLVTPERHVGTAIGITQTAFPVGVSIGPLLGSALIGLVGLRGMFAVDAALALVAALLLAQFFREPKEHDRGASLGAKLAETFALVAHVPAIRWSFVALFLMAAGTRAIDAYLPVLIARLYSGPDVATAIGLVLAVTGALAALTAPVIGRLVQRVGFARVLVGGSLVQAGTALGLSLAGSFLPAAVLAQGQALTIPLNVAINSLLVQHVPRAHRASVLALTPVSRNAAGLVAPLAAAGLAGLGLEAVFRLSAACSAGALGASLLLGRAGGARAEAQAPPARGGPPR